MPATSLTRPVPSPDSPASFRTLKALLRERHPLAALQALHAELGDVFRIPLPAFSPVVLVGPEAARFVLVESRHDLRWRNPSDPVTRLLRHGVLVEDGEEHERLRRLMNPSLHRRMLSGYVETMWSAAEIVAASWRDGQIVDMLVEMRKVALLILTETLFQVDFQPDLARMWRPVLDSIRYISPGLWLLWGGVPRPQYRRNLLRMDAYLYQIIQQRRDQWSASSEPAKDLLGTLIAAGLDDGLIRDQLLTMLIAGHDTSTALLAWALYLLGSDPEAMQAARQEVLEAGGSGPIRADQIKNLPYLTAVIREALRLYPPIHLGSRVAARDLEYRGFQIPEGERVLYSIYLTQRHPDLWQEPERFDPARYLQGRRPPPYTWLAFGGGPRNCIGAAFGLVEAQVVLAYLLGNFDLQLARTHVRPHMGATLEPHPGVNMQVTRLPA